MMLNSACRFVLAPLAFDGTDELVNVLNASLIVKLDTVNIATVLRDLVYASIRVSLFLEICFKSISLLSNCLFGCDFLFELVMSCFFRFILSFVIVFFCGFNFVICRFELSLYFIKFLLYFVGLAALIL